MKVDANRSKIIMYYQVSEENNNNDQPIDYDDIPEETELDIIFKRC